ncbi:alpha/beta fold hydrolase [Beijerinckia sp. L45]|uniref:alpha/beta fold hydrolase n=1 Tax=Beijerinckia sp. L45 TaxID=1641855 RepID=UPI00131D842E|nr:alpha/beta hydrolase [Beijerinckia sp. L45]
MLKSVDAGVLHVAYSEVGDADGWPVMLMHGFPYDIHAYDDVAPRLASQGARVIIPYLRGFGPTRFLSAETPRSGQQAALGADLLALMDALAIPDAVLAGYDWGGRAACIVAALWPARACGLVSYQSYNIHNLAKSMEPDTPDNEHRLWYQYYFHGERGRAGLAKDRQAFCRLLWGLWSPAWAFDDATYARTAGSFDNPDFVDVVIQSYRHRFGLAAGDPNLEDIEQKLAALPKITVPTVTIDGGTDGIRPAGTASHAGYFAGRHEHRVFETAGHNVPQEVPDLFAKAVLDVKAWSDV